MKKKSVLDLKRISQEEFKRVEKISLTVILDNVRSLNNIGSVFRTADAFRVECIYLCGITATPPHTDIHKTALGAEDSVDWVYFQDTCEAVDNLLVTARPLPSYIQTHERSSPFPCQYSRSTWIPRLKEDRTSPLRGV